MVGELRPLVGRGKDRDVLAAGARRGSEAVVASRARVIALEHPSVQVADPTRRRAQEVNGTSADEGAHRLAVGPPGTTPSTAADATWPVPRVGVASGAVGLVALARVGSIRGMQRVPRGVMTVPIPGTSRWCGSELTTRRFAMRPMVLSAGAGKRPDVVPDLGGLPLRRDPDQRGANRRGRPRLGRGPHVHLAPTSPKVSSPRNGEDGHVGRLDRGRERPALATNW